jgi:hypothetical protein
MKEKVKEKRKKKKAKTIPFQLVWRPQERNRINNNSVEAIISLIHVLYTKMAKLCLIISLIGIAHD